MTLQLWYVLPLAMAIAAIATASGIGGATFGAPVFALVAGLPSEVAIAAALVTEVFGMASAVVAHARRGLIDYGLGKPVLATVVPSAVIGAWLSGSLDERALRLAIGVGLVAVAIHSIRRLSRERRAHFDEVIASRSVAAGCVPRLTAANGKEYHYTPCNHAEGRLVAAVGAFFKGLIATGLGEMNDDFFLERCRVPSRVSIATSDYVLLFASLAGGIGHLARFVLRSPASIAPLGSLLVFSVPGVILGGQIGARLAARAPERLLEWGLRILLLAVAAFAIAEALAGQGGS
jgi:uncharacterized membrane protein YfcA